MGLKLIYARRRQIWNTQTNEIWKHTKHQDTGIVRESPLKLSLQSISNITTHFGKHINRSHRFACMSRRSLIELKLGNVLPTIFDKILCNALKKHTPKEHGIRVPYRICDITNWERFQTHDQLLTLEHVYKYCADILTHRGRVTHTCVSKLTIIGSDNGLSPDRRQAII